MEDLSPIEQAEAHLRAVYSYNVEHKIWPSHNVVIDRLLADNINMALVYDELFRICPRGYPRNSNYEYWQYVINAIVETASGWNPEQIKSVRDAVKEIKGADGTKGLNQSIKEKASELAALLRKRNRICELNNLARPDDYHPIDLIEPATEIASKNGGYGDGTHYRYTSWVKKDIDKLRGQFDLKYWPGTADMLDALADMQDIEPAPRNKLDAAALAVRQAWRRVNAGTLRSLTLVADPRLDDASATAWYLAASPAQIDHIVRAYLAGQGRPYFEQRLGFETDGMEIKSRLDFGVGVIDYRGLYKNPGAA